MPQKQDGPQKQILSENWSQKCFRRNSAETKRTAETKDSAETPAETKMAPQKHTPQKQKWHRRNNRRNESAVNYTNKHGNPKFVIITPPHMERRFLQNGDLAFATTFFRAFSFANSRRNFSFVRSFVRSFRSGFFNQISNFNWPGLGPGSARRRGSARRGPSPGQLKFEI